MRIAYVCADPGVPVFGFKGCSVHVQEVISALLSNGAEVELFAVRTGGDPPPTLRNLPIHALPTPAQAGLAGRERATFAANGHLWSALEREGPFDMVYERYSLWSFAGVQYASEHKIPGMLEVNAPLIEEQAAHRGLVARDLATSVSEKVFASASALLAVSREVASYLETFPGTSGRIHVVPNGVDPHRFSSGPAPALPAPGVFTVGFVGTLKPWHGLPTLIDAFALLHRRDQSTRLLIVGDGPERPNLEAAIHDPLSPIPNPQSILFTGAVAPADIPSHLASMDVAVAPYPEQDTFYFSPLKVYEYMAAGLPVVASRVGQLAGLINDGETGLLCPPGDVPALAAALDRLRLDPDLRTRLGAGARSTALRAHTWDGVVRRILALARAASPYSLSLGSK
jgi:glycosyltransferase involved in cell wall biosynthesis